MPQVASSSTQTFNEARLVFFLNSHLFPILSEGKLVGRSQRTTEGFAHPQLLETFLWLHHGVETEYFPIESSRRVMYEYFPLFLLAYESPLVKQNIETWFSPGIRAIFTSEFSGKSNLFSYGEILKRSEKTVELQSIFESFLLLASSFNQAEKTHPLIEPLVMFDRKAWSQIILHSPDKASPSSHHEGWLSDGLLDVIRYLQAYRLASSDAYSSAPSATLQDYLRLLKETQQWKLNFGYPTYRERFLDVAQIAAATIKPSSTVDSQFLERSFLDSIYDLITDWGAPVIKAAGA